MFWAQIDLGEVENLDKKLAASVEKSLKTISPKGKEILRDEIPQGATGLTKEAISTDEKADEIIYKVSRKAGDFDVAVGLVEGTGVYGPKRTRIVPKNAKVLKIPVASLGALGLANLKPKNGFVFLKSVKGMKPNPFDDRAAKKMAQTLPEKLADEIIKNL